jgi:hypothetical protein
MMKMMILAPRRAGMTHAEFCAYVTGVHGPLVKSVTEVAADIRHYHYNFPVIGAQDDAFGHPIADHLDIVTQGWFDSRLAQLANMARPRYLEIVRPDEHKFADGSRAVMHYTHEIEITGGPKTRRKIFYFRRRRAGLSREDFQTRWRRGFTEIVADSAVWPRIVSHFLQNHVLEEESHPNGHDPKFFDVMDEIFLAEEGSIGALRQDEKLVARLRELEDQLLDTSRTQALVTQTTVNIA